MSFRDVINNVSEFSGVDGDPRKAKILINRMYQHLLRRHQWSFLKDTAIITTLPTYSTGTVAATKGSKTVTGTGTTWTSSHVGYIRIDNSGAFYEINTVDSNTQITLRDNYAGNSVSGVSYIIFKHIYNISNVREILAIVSQLKLIEKDADWMDRNDPERRFISSFPDYYARRKRTYGNSVDIEFSPVPNANIGIRIHYLKNIPDLAADSDTFIIDEFLVEKFVIAEILKREAVKEASIRMMWEREIIDAEKIFVELVQEDNRNWGSSKRVKLDDSYYQGYSDTFYSQHDLDW